MAEPNFAWIYIIIFMAIPLARIIPRLLAKRGIGKNFLQPSSSTPYSDLQKQRSETNFGESPTKRNFADPSTEPNFADPSFERQPQADASKPPTKKQLVLGALNRGSKTFEDIQKNTGLDASELDSILDDLEKNGLLKVLHKQGMLGPKTELYPTDKGFKEYYS